MAQHPGHYLKWHYLHPSGMTQRELANRVDVEVKTINRLINGHTRLSAVMAIKLAEVFDCKARDLMSYQIEHDLELANSKERK